MPSLSWSNWVGGKVDKKKEDKKDAKKAEKEASNPKGKLGMQ